MSAFLCVLLCSCFALMSVYQVDSHGLMNHPNPRGCLAKRKFIPVGVDNSAPIDKKAHYPAGDKTNSPGAGSKSQRDALFPDLWKPFTPLKRHYKWGFGVCGDLKGNRLHLKPANGKKSGYSFYYGGKIVAKYEEGGIIDVGMTVNAHHNGFIELHICDVQKCGGEISENCFREGHCKQLKRAPNGDCDNGMSKLCGPIDRKYKGRWYLPCSQVKPNSDEYEFFGKNDKTIQYKLPERLTCKHCVLQWYWTSASTCNPEGVVSYFEGPDGPKNWGNCQGQGGAVGGYTTRQKKCGSTHRDDHYPEEYVMCADIAIVAKGRTPVAPPTDPRKTTPPKRKRAHDLDGSKHGYNVAKHRAKGNGPIRDLVLIGDGKRVVSLHDKSKIDVSKLRDITIEALMAADAEVEKVRFFVDDVLQGSRKEIPYVMYGWENGEPVPWKGVPFNKEVTIKAHCLGDTDKVRVTLVRK